MLNLDRKRIFVFHYRRFPTEVIPSPRVQGTNLYTVLDDSAGYEMQCFFTSWNPPKCHSRKIFNCQVHQDMKLNTGL